MPMKARVARSASVGPVVARRRHKAGRSAQSHGKEGGFSLVEVVLAMALLLAMLAATSSLVVTGLQVGQDSRLKQIATDIAASTLDCAVASLNVAAVNFPTPCGEPVQLVKALNSYTSLATVTRGGFNFTIEQEVEPGSGTCGVPSGGAPPELQVVDWVTWAPNPGATWWTKLPGSVGSRYVEETTVVAVPAIALNPNDGSIRVQITDDVSNGQRSLSVVATDTNTNTVYTATTTDLGCALFLNMPPDPYTVTVSPSSGTYIDSNNDMSGGSPAPFAGPNMSGNVIASSTLTLPTNAKPYYYAQAANVNATYTVPQINGLTWAQPYVTSAGDLATSLPLSFWNSEPNGLSTDPYVAAPPPAGGDPVFPFQASSPSYYVVAGSCGIDSSPDGFTGGNPIDGVGIPGSGSLPPGQLTTANFTLQPIAVAVTNGGSDLSGAIVAARAADPTGRQDATNCPASGPAVMPTLQMGQTSPASAPAVGGSSTTVLESGSDPSISGQAVTFSATVAATAGEIGTPTGTVSFYETGTGASCPAGTLIGTGSLSSSGTASSPPVTLSDNCSPYSITATYGGDGNFSGSSATALAQTVEPTGQDYATTITASSSASTSLVNNAVTFTATVSSAGNGSPSTGSVSFCEDGTGLSCTGGRLIGAATPVNGIAAVTHTFTATGTHTITAIYVQGADLDFASSTSPSAAVTQTVVSGPPDPTTTTVTSSSSGIVNGETVTFTATVTPTPPVNGTPSGTIAFEDGATVIAGCGSETLSAGTATCTDASLSAPPNSQTITAVFTSSDPNFAGSSGTLTETVVGNDTLSSLPDGYFLLGAKSSDGSKLSTNTSTAVILKVGSGGVSEITCSGGSYSGNYYSGVGCSAPQALSPGAIITVPVS
jgi:hypothetical protein